MRSFLTSQVFFFLLSSTLAVAQSSRTSPANADKAEISRISFSEASQVFMHARCLNCHPAGDRPTQGMDLHPHIMNVQRGEQDHGARAMNCMACHGTSNNLNSKVPGAPKWGLAPKDMAWQGLNASELCETLKKSMKIHHMSMEAFIKHNAEDKLVGWAWNAGEGREAPPISQQHFGALLQKWADNGAECPKQTH